MRTKFSNLKDGSKFRYGDDGVEIFTKINDTSYSVNNRIGNIGQFFDFVVYPFDVSDLKNPDKRDRWNKNLDILGVMKLFLIGCVVLWILCAIFSSHDSNSNQPDYLGAAEDKMDKGLPLNSQEKKAVDDAVGGQDQSKDIEKKHGE